MQPGFDWTYTCCYESTLTDHKAQILCLSCCTVLWSWMECSEREGKTWLQRLWTEIGVPNIVWFWGGCHQHRQCWLWVPKIWFGPEQKWKNKWKIELKKKEDWLRPVTRLMYMKTRYCWISVLQLSNGNPVTYMRDETSHKNVIQIRRTNNFKV